MTERAPAPFFHTAESSGSQLRRGTLLLISYHFPPSGEVGGIRWQQFSRFAAERGWALDVICRDPRDLDVRDESRLAELPPGIRLFGVRDGEPWVSRWLNAIWGVVRSLRSVTPARSVTSFASQQVREEHSIRGITRTYFAWLDFARGLMWARAAAQLGTTLAGARQYSAVISSGPPHLAHEAARKVAGAASLPLVIDFRDPWSKLERLAERLASPTWFRLAEKYEKRVVSAATLVIVNTDASRTVMRRQYPSATNRIITVNNGTDGGLIPASNPDSRFTIRFAGTIYLDRDPRLFFRAASRVVRDLQLTPSQFGILFIGDVQTVGSLPLETMAAEEGLTGFVEIGPPLPRSAALAFLSSGALLLNLPQDSHLCIPAKIFEYVGIPAWMLVLAEKESATAQLLRGTDADVVDPSDIDRMANVIQHRYEQFARGERPHPVGRDGRFARRIQADILFDRIHELVTARE